MGRTSQPVAKSHRTVGAAAKKYGALTVTFFGTYWVLFIAIPLVALLLNVRFHVGKFFDPSILSLVKVTAAQASWSTALSGVVGLFLGVACSRQRRLQLLLALPFAISSTVVAYTVMAWFGRKGFLPSFFGIQLPWLFSMKAVVLAHVLLNAPWIGFLVAGAMGEVPRREMEAARTLGAKPAQVGLHIVWSHIVEAWASGLVQVFALCVMSFAIVLILGGGPPNETLEVSIYTHIRYGALDLGGAVASALWQLVLTLTPWLLLLFYWNRTGVRQLRRELAPLSLNVSRKFHFWDWIAAGAVALFFIPYLWIFIQTESSKSFTEFLFGENTWAEWVPSFQVSLKLALSSAVITVAVALSGVVSGILFPRLEKWSAVLLSFPGGVSTLVLALGFWLAYSRWVDPFEGSWLAIAILQATVFLPIALRIFRPIASAVQFHRIDAARSLGASPLRAIRWTEFYRWKGPVFAAFGMAAGVSLGELAAVSFFYSEKLIPLPLLMSRWLNRYRFDDARGISILLFLTATALVALSTYSGLKPRERRFA
ncbi:ABC transporter permease subunit [bacterium]|jgi:thiamine transport system permease protein|nr:ABC transporter permease subunit [bacterium]